MGFTDRVTAYEALLKVSGRAAHFYDKVPMGNWDISSCAYDPEVRKPEKVQQNPALMPEPGTWATNKKQKSFMM